MLTRMVRIGTALGRAIASGENTMGRRARDRRGLVPWIVAAFVGVLAAAGPAARPAGAEPEPLNVKERLAAGRRRILTAGAREPRWNGRFENWDNDRKRSVIKSFRNGVLLATSASRRWRPYAARRIGSTRRRPVSIYEG